MEKLVEGVVIALMIAVLAVASYLTLTPYLGH